MSRSFYTARFIGLFLGVSASFAGGGNAYAFCSEPLGPVCMEDGANFDSVASRQRCESDIEAFEKKLDEYESCLSKKISEIDTLKERVAERKREILEKNKD